MSDYLTNIKLTFILIVVKIITIRLKHKIYGIIMPNTKIAPISVYYLCSFLIFI